MSDLLSIGSSAVQVYQRALGTVSNNVANMATEGYSRQEAVILDNAPREVASMYFGTGSRVDAIQRLYDDFIERGLRTSISDVETQEPLVSYSSRIVDIMGSQINGLTPVLEDFFRSARMMSTDPASIELRSQLIAQTDGLAARFRTLSGQFDAIEIETREAVQVDVDRINTLSTQLAAVNLQLSRKSELKHQAPMLLDQRDQLLRDLSGVARIRVSEDRNGMVDVSIGPSDRQGRIVIGREVKPLVASYDRQTYGVKLVLDPLRSAEVVSGVSSGTLGGLINFRDQILRPAVAELDFLAQTVTTYFNATHRVGVDLDGKLGTDLMTIDPVYQINDSTLNSDIAVQWDVIDPAETRFHDIRLSFDPESGRWTALDQIDGRSASGTESIIINGLQIRLTGLPKQSESLVLEAQSRPAAGIRRLLDDPRLLAAAAPLRVIEEPANPSGVDAQVLWQPDGRDELPLRSITEFPVSSSLQTQTIDFQNSDARPASVLGRIPAGIDSVRLSLQTAVAEPLDLQVFTRDGRHLAGQALDAASQRALVQTAAGFIPGASYSDAYLNQAGEQGYLDLDISYGARAEVLPVEVRDFEGRVSETRLQTALLESRSIPPARQLQAGIPFIADGALRLNGQALQAFKPDVGPIEAAQIVSWLNGEIARLGLGPTQSPAQPGLIASARTEIRIPPDAIRLDAPLELNGVAIASTPAPASLEALVDRINQQSNLSGVVAAIGLEGELLLQNAPGQEGRDIEVGPTGIYPGSALTIYAGRHTGQLTIYVGDHTGERVVEATDSPPSIQLDIGATGSPADLSRLGLSTEVWINGRVPEDLIIIATGSGAGRLSALYGGRAEQGLAAVRERDFRVEFFEVERAVPGGDPVQELRWRIFDQSTGTELADRPYDPSQGIHYLGMQLSLAGPPIGGDVFRIDGNHDGVGDNQNLLRLAGLERSREIVPGSRTLAESWLDRLNSIGNLGTQAKIAQQALQVVHEQAIEARDRVSGVNLDEEATDLIRFQQAYQASAKVVQTANQLFDAIVALR